MTPPRSTPPAKDPPAGTDDGSGSGGDGAGGALSKDDVQSMIDAALAKSSTSGAPAGDDDKRYTRVELEEEVARRTAEAQAKLDKGEKTPTTPPASGPGDSKGSTTETEGSAAGGAGSSKAPETKAPVEQAPIKTGWEKVRRALFGDG